ncbi:MAG: KOW motif-containing protein [Prevotella sp.]|nr:KOW motif-containing protein [Prevotella sp.]MBR1504615.1 KOW motif-containing protein [Prevotella sp.]
MPERKDGYEWYVFRASYGREDRAKTLLERLQVFSYVPRHTVYRRTKTGVKSEVRNLLPNFVFAYLTAREARLLAKGPVAHDTFFDEKSRQDQEDILALNTLLSFYYNHFVKGNDGMNPPLVVPYHQMKEFFIATRLEKDVIPLSPGTFRVGEEVEVVEGDFKGLTGKVLYVHSNKKRLKVRLMFQLPCLGSFGSASIPISYFRKIE